ncbi:hypothetical protein [Maribacter dokdonensis]|uniref:hypothetical protein n=1 Tax=Maribacter dokdonensis TaxID=320912 RepID=UPI00071994FB|nr:hypothetical protein [Maribacter dokdonensis]KSA15352.1 hypothetical protein I600_1965 [Maribacter dokdonensis DSW-8]
MRTILILILLAFSNLSNAQLTDFFGKTIVHEIKLNKLDDGTYAGAMEWTTGGADSLQRFIINGLDVKTPVMVRIISKAPDHNIDLSFHKESWEKVESKVSTNGEKFVDKVFRTMNTAGIGVSSEVAEIPYLITVKTGLQFPSTQSLIRFTDDIEEYNQYVQTLGVSGNIISLESQKDSEAPEISLINKVDKENNLMYIIIGLLIAIIILFVLFIFKKQKTKKLSIITIGICSFANTYAQSSQPRPIPISDKEPAVFIEYRSENVSNQVPINYTSPNHRPAEDRTVHLEGDDGTTHVVRLEPNQGSLELSGDAAAAVERRIREADEQFNEDYGANSPGEPTESDARILPDDLIHEELARLRNQVRRLQAQVDLLSQQDQHQEDEGEDEEPPILVYCEVKQDCKNCAMKPFNRFRKRHTYFMQLQRFYYRKRSDLNAAITSADALASVPGAGLGWSNIKLYQVRPAMEKLKLEYDKKFNQYISDMTLDIHAIEGCLATHSQTTSLFKTQATLMLANMRTSRITF